MVLETFEGVYWAIYERMASSVESVNGMYECCRYEDLKRGLGAFLEEWGDRTTKPFGLRTGRLPIFNLPPVSPGQRPFFLGFMRVFGESYLPLLGAIRWSVNTEFIPIYI